MQDRTDPAISERELGRKLAIAIHAADLGIWEWDLRTNEFVYSDRAREIFGFADGGDVSRERIIAVLHPGDHEIAREQAARGLDPALEKRDPYRYRIYRENDGAMRWIQAFGEPVFETVDGKPDPIRYVGTLQDVTEEVLAQDRLVQQEARLRLAIEASGVAVWELNLADQTVTHSPELNRLCGFPPDARPTLEEFRSRYAPGERERLEREGAEIRSRGGTSYETEIRHIWPDGTEKWLLMRAQLAPGETDYGGRVIGVLVDITEQKKREEQQALLVSEFQHRIRNSFAVAQSIVSHTLRNEGISEEARAKLSGRFQAMANAHEVIAGGAWDGASLLRVVDRVVQAFGGQRNGRIDVRVADLDLSPQAGLSVSLVLHELFTNALKYGSLSTPEGRLHIRAETEAGAILLLRLTWEERDGPPVAEPGRTGFGTRLTDHLCAEYGATINRRFEPGGLRVDITIPIQQLGRQR